MRKLLFAFALIAPLSGSLSAQTWQQSPVNGHWYTATSPMTWHAGEAHAVSIGGHLATVRSQAENAWILATYYLPGDSLWIGYTDQQVEGTWLWTSGETPGYTNWYPGEPNDLGGEDYAALDTTNGTWNDGDPVPIRALIEVISADCDGNGLPDVYELAINPGLDLNGNGILDICENLGSGFCFGDPGSGTQCPCGNDNDGSVPGSGCNNGAFPSGAHLIGSGLANVLDDTLVLTTTGLEPNNAGLYFQANNAVNGGNGHWFGDGLRCAGGGVVRLQVRFSDSAGTSSTTIPIGATGGVSPGDTKYYQCWYRTSVNPPCGSGINDFNTSNGYQVTWTFGGQGNMMPVPAGTFDMGDHHGVGFPQELPVHTVELDAFYMDVSEVSNQQYADYLNTAYAQGLVAVSFTGVVLQVGGSGLPMCDTTTFSADSRITWDGLTFGVVTGKEDHPMVQVSWHGACAFANGLSLAHGLTPCYDETTWDCDFTVDGYRLPTEAEWEYAARGGTYPPYAMYPWGNTIDGSQANYNGSGDPHEGNSPETTPVSYYDGNQTPPGVDMVNGYGLYDVAGNISEWCWDWYDENYYANSPSGNPTGPTVPGSRRVTRGGNWRNAPTSLRSADRGKAYPTERFDATGFRVVAANL